jgi:hypothetical protein
MDSLLPLLVFLLISGAAAWLKRRQRTNETESSPEPPPASLRPRPGAPPASAPQPPPTSSWQEELRRLLEGEMPGQAPPPIQPQNVPPAPRPVPPPLPRPVVITRLRAPPPPLTAKPAARPPPKVVAVSPMDESAEAPSARLATMAESTAAFQRASHLHDGVTRHLEQIDAQTEHHLVKAPISQRRSMSPDVAQAVSLTRNPRSARQAVVAAIILGPPKALER